MNILISVNNKYLNQIKTALFSLSLFTNSNVTVYLMNHSLDGQDVISLKEYLKEKCNFNLIEIDVKKTALDSFPVYLHLSIETYYRLLAQFLLPDTVDRILWLDADVIIFKDITDFYNQDFDEQLLIACADVNHNRQDILNVKKEIGISQNHLYFNAGIILFNLEKLRKETTKQEILNTCQKLKSKVVFMDQDILNYLYQCKVKYENPKKYNYQLTNDPLIEKKDLEDIHILHYSGPNKPWDYKQFNKTSKYYWNIKIKQGCGIEYFKIITIAAVYKIFMKVKRIYLKQART
ncbi:MAG TPA: glycosyltransferase family 8 protein [Erysipelotrichaceae bacterium]|nr:glycosyltransferase family 8 protein [Erysipelotrichia bacterium]HPX32286.1 glycosyltransferase family 8 protein [Erysipelotrichaceae bacterium]HQA84797.1 glycosyltransferase family 8 protein [Erysipelotrichaceae bacterium]